MANLARGAKIISDLTAAQSAAASAQLGLNNIPLSGSSWNGNALSGLNPRDSDPALWINADPLQKNTASATATVKQTAANALLTWQSFDLNKGEKLVFDQQEHADWTVLNRIVAGPRDASGSRFVASPSRILGSIEAPGSVYVINPNGIVFGGSAQVNVHSLIASSLDVGAPTMTVGERNNFFLNLGILGNSGAPPAANFSYNAGDRLVEGDITVEAGAKITAALAPRAISSDAGGFVYLFAPNVTNAGTISTPAGETLMVAAQIVKLIANGYPASPRLQDPTAAAAFRGVGIDPYPDPNGTLWRTDGPASAQIAAPGRVTNTGLIDAERGIVILDGDLVTNGSGAGSTGTIRTNTSITRNGQIYLDARLQLNLSGGSLQILPAENGETIPQSALDKFAPGSIELQSQTIDIDSGALVLAPGASISVLSEQPTRLGDFYPKQLHDVQNNYLKRIYMGADSTIDVSGLQDVARPMSDNFLTFKPFGNEFADQPLQRNGALRGQSLTVDLRRSGTLNGSNWIGTPLANLAGYANSSQQGIDQLLTTGGKVALSASDTGGGEIVLRQGSVINVGGGTVRYTGDVPTESKLLTADGRMVSISRADPLDTFVGVVGTTLLEHPHWGATTTQSFNSPLLSGAGVQSDYVEGHDAGAIALQSTFYVLDGSFLGGVISGDRQRALGQRPSAGDSSLAMPNAGSLTLAGKNNLIISESAAPAGFGPLDPFPSDALQNTRLSAQKLRDGNLGMISANFSGQLQVDADVRLEVAPGGRIDLAGGSVDIEGNLVARSGAISIASIAHLSGESQIASVTGYVPTGPVPPGLFDLIIGSKAVLDVSGIWVNDTGAAPADLQGGAFIDGGSINLKTSARSAICLTVACKTLPGLEAGAPAVVDLTGNIVLAKGALLDASSGGRITDRGIFMLDSKGRAAGKGGNISFQTYVDGFNTLDRFSPTTSLETATLRLAGSDGSAAGNASALDQAVKAFGFSQGGTFALQLPGLEIGGSSVLGDFSLPAGFFDGNAFGAYQLTSVAGGLSVAPGTAVRLRQRNLVADAGLSALATGAKPSDVAAVDFLPDFIRQPVNLSLAAQLPFIPVVPFNLAADIPAAVVSISLPETASIQADPGAAIAVSVTGRVAYSPSADAGGLFPIPIPSQIAVAEILGSLTAPGGAITLTAGANASLWLGSQSRLDVSGVSLADNRQLLFHSGAVLPGGTVAITAQDPSGSVVGLHGALISVSGAAGTFDLPSDTPTLAGQKYAATALWSDAGAITLSASTLLYDGAFLAQPGAPAGKGGSLTVIAPETSGGAGAEQITVRQGGDTLPAGLRSTDALGALAGNVVFLADRLTGSGVQDLTISMGPVSGDAVGGPRFTPGTLSFSGNVALGGLDRLFLDAAKISLIDIVAPTNAAGCNVCIDAHYVALRGAGRPSKVAPIPGSGNLRISGDMIDIAAGGFSVSGADLLSISGTARTDFVSKGDIRLRVPLANVSDDPDHGTLPMGVLVTAGDLGLTAAQIYPVSGVDFTLKSLAAGGTISFAASGAPQAAPLSAGGQLTVSAAHIVQGGRLLAPLGTIRLGAQTPADLAPHDASASLVPTQSVIFSPGSVTSVSLDGQIVPFGRTANGSSWSYDSRTGQPLAGPPAKNLIVSSAGIDVASGATLDLSGGGDIQAIEFVSGTGGTRDVLSGANVYAIIPGYDPIAAPIDFDFAIQRHDALPVAGSTVFLSGDGSLPAGRYTLLPAHYATLPGAYRVAVTANGGLDPLVSSNMRLQDGTSRMAGYFANGISNTRDAHSRSFDVQASAIWRQYTEIDQVLGNAFFGPGGPGTSTVPPRLAQDAGRVVFSASNAINLQGQINSAHGAAGRGGEVDVAARDIQVLSPGASGRSGYVWLDATQLSNLAADSLLLGGIRKDTDDGQSITVVANSVEISNDASAPLQAPEIILVARIGSGATDPNASRRLTFDAGSVVQAKGTVANAGTKKFTIGNKPLGIAGNGALVAVSNGSVLTVERQNLPVNNGTITLAGAGAGKAGAFLGGENLILDTSGNIIAGTGVQFKAANISVAAKSINFGTPQRSAGFNIGSDMAGQLQSAQSLTLRSLQTIDFSSDTDFALSGLDSRLILDTATLSSGLVSGLSGNKVTLSAGKIDLINSGGVKPVSAGGSGNLTLSAAEILLGGGEKSFSGFASARFSASSSDPSRVAPFVAARDTGSLDAGQAALTIQAPLLLVGTGSDQTVTTSGAVVLDGGGVPGAAQSGEVGGNFALTGQSITFKNRALLQATSGGVSLTAAVGDIALEANTGILANGFVATFFDTTRTVGGGAVQLVANQGSIDIASNAAIDVSSPISAPGYAGQIVLSAANGNLRSQGGTFDMGVIAGTVAGDSGGRLTIDAQDIGSDLVAPPMIFSDLIDIHLRQGNLVIASDIRASTSVFTADGGTLTVAHAIDAAGKNGGSISLFGRDRVILTAGARLLATASDGSKRGGDVTIGAGAAGDLKLQAGVIDVSNTKNAANGGTVKFRAPLTATGDDVAIGAVGTAVLGAASVTVEGYRVFDTHNSAFNGVIDPAGQGSFFGSCSATGVCGGTLIDFVQNFALSAGARAKFAAISPAVLHLQPGIELVNGDPGINNGDITVASNWNLGAGLAGYLVNRTDYSPKGLPVVPAGTVMTDASGQLLPQYAGYKGDLTFLDGVSQISSLYYRVGGSVTGEAGTLTLRAARDVNINNSISDGFFSTRNVFDAGYQRDLIAWIDRYISISTTDLSNVGGYLIAGATYARAAADPKTPAPLIPYDIQANAISPVFSQQIDKTPIAGADLFPLIESAGGPISGNGKSYRAVESWSYRITSGADTASANPLAMQPLAAFGATALSPLAGHGDVTIDGHTQYGTVHDFNASYFITLESPTIVRTGTGSIDIAAARDFVLADKKAPGVVYTAGRNSVDLPDPGYALQSVDNPLAPGEKIDVPIAADPTGFLKPQVIACNTAFSCNTYGPNTQAAYPVGGGRLTLSAQRDIIGFEHPTVASPGSGGNFPNQQYFAPWLLSQGTNLSSTDFGPFSVLSAYLSAGGEQLFTPMQTSWWINFGSFDQGLMSVGGDVTVTAGRDIQELSVSLPTTARVSGGLSNTITDAHGNLVANIPVMHLNGSGDLTVVAGRDIKSGAYYEGSGDARILVGRSTSASWAANEDNSAGASHPVSTILALDTGTIALQARGNIDIGGVVSGPSLQNVADIGMSTVFEQLSQSISSYGPSSAVSLLSAGGDIVANSLTFDVALVNNPHQIIDAPDNSAYPGVGRYPASFDAVAANGDVEIAQAFRLASSQTGTVNLLAHGSLKTYSAGSVIDLKPLSTGASLVEAVFDPVNPMAGFGPAPGSLSFDLGPILLHQNDSRPNLFYAATGDIIAPTQVSENPDENRIPLAWEITKPAKVRAAGDIIDLSYFGQNLQTTDITTIIAGRDLSYTGGWQALLGFMNIGIPDIGANQNLGGLSLAGPGFFDVEAGRNLGPFVTAAANITASTRGLNVSDPIGTGIVTFGNTVVVGNRRMFSSQNPGVADPFATGANNKMARRGADIVALFGVAGGVDYGAVIQNYVDPVRSSSSRGYLPALVTYLQTLGYPLLSQADAWTTFATLPAGLQNIFAEKVFLSEIKLPGQPDGCCYKDYAVAYAMINTLFPVSLGYTDNEVAGDAKPVLRHTGNLDLLHATVKSLQSGNATIAGGNGTVSDIAVGGNIAIFGPGGSINVGTTALEIRDITLTPPPPLLDPAPKNKLSNSSLGVLTLNGGAISTFTDSNVLINQSRMLTVQGGDILMWSSNGDLDAGRGAKTSVDFKPLSVNFDPANLQTINLNGLVSGAGIGTIRSTPDAPAASTTLIAPRGTINAGDAGLRSSGNLDIVAFLVLNAANISAAGNVSGVPSVNSVNLSALESASASGGQAAQVADASVAAAANRGSQSVIRSIPALFTVEVLGFGDCDPEGGRGCAAN